MSWERSMASLLATMLLILVVTASSDDTDDSLQKTLSVFELGKFTPITASKSNINVFKPPKPLVIISPKEAGDYPILFFIHGTATPNYEYSNLYNFIASHGIIVVAPMLYKYIIVPILPSHQEEIDDAATVANWLSSNLNTAKVGKSSVHILPDNVTANFNNFTVSGHSRGGKSAFALALGKTKKTKLTQKISALVGLDPVAGRRVGNIKIPTEPYILTNKANSLNLSIPTMIIGTGVTPRFGPSCTPKDLNDDQFFKEMKQGSHFVVTDFGHGDMLDAGMTAYLQRRMCGTTRKGSYDVMRTTVGGLYVAFFDAYFGGNPEQYQDILSNPFVAPTKLNPVDKKVWPQYHSDA